MMGPPLLVYASSPHIKNVIKIGPPLTKPRMGSPALSMFYLYLFFLQRGEGIQVLFEGSRPAFLRKRSIKVGHHRLAKETPFKCCFP